MAKWLTASVLIITLAGSALAGFPLHSEEKECSMMGEMSCCATARASEATPAVTTARLCCALNCPQQGTSGTTITLQFSPSVVTALHHVEVRPPVIVLFALRRFNNTPISPPGSQPIYIRHLAILI
jgi:hypothetical protein